jgi:hypothetical protein
MEHLLSESLFPSKRPSKKNLHVQDSDTTVIDSKNESKKDPLSSQIWRLYTKAKDNLPNGSRLENMTWRMMAMTLNKRRNSAGMEIDQQGWSSNSAVASTSSSAPASENFYLPSDQAAVEFAKQTMPMERAVISSTGFRSHENSNLSEQQRPSTSYNHRTYALTDSQVRTSVLYAYLYTSVVCEPCGFLVALPLLRHFLPAFHHNVLIPIAPYLNPHRLTIGRTGFPSSCIFFL